MVVVYGYCILSSVSRIYVSSSQFCYIGAPNCKLSVSLVEKFLCSTECTECFWILVVVVFSAIRNYIWLGERGVLAKSYM